MSKDEVTTYEANVVGMRGILLFLFGVLLMVVISFGLMWVFQYKVLEDQALEDDKANENPMARSAKDSLPAEPRLQSAPGFGVNSKEGRVNLELREPQAEYREILKQWEKSWKEGEKDTKTKTVISLPIEEAKDRVIKGNLIKARAEKE